MLESGGTTQRLEVGVNAKVWRFEDNQAAMALMIELDGRYDHVILAESFALRPKKSWVVIAWRPIGSIG